MSECNCEILPPHAKEYHDKVVKALKANPNQHFVIKAGVPYLVEAGDLIRELEAQE